MCTKWTRFPACHVKPPTELEDWVLPRSGIAIRNSRVVRIAIAHRCSLPDTSSNCQRVPDSRFSRGKRLGGALFERIGAWIDFKDQSASLSSAIGYVRNQWDALCVYATQGFLSIDNNAAERALKRVAIGRKNWLFAGNDRAGQTAATLYTLIASAERHGVDPQRYLTSVLAKIAVTPAAELAQFLPDAWKRADQSEPPPPPPS